MVISYSVCVQRHYYVDGVNSEDGGRLCSTVHMERSRLSTQNSKLTESKDFIFFAAAKLHYYCIHNGPYSQLFCNVFEKWLVIL